MVHLRVTMQAHMQSYIYEKVVLALWVYVHVHKSCIEEYNCNNPKFSHTQSRYWRLMLISSVEIQLLK